MGDLYYKLWVDAINYEITKHKTFRSWQVYTMVGISVAQGMNLALMFVGIGSFAPIGFFFNIDVFPGTFLGSAISSIITLFLPFVGLNYFLIFYKKKYLKLLSKYQPQGGKLYFGYFICSFAVFIIPFALAKLLD